jgi:hypothetical protein
MFPEGKCVDLPANTFIRRQAPRETIKNKGALHMREKLFDRRFIRLFAIALASVMVVSALAANTGRAIAARNDMTYTLDQPNNYKLIEKGDYSR